MEQTYQKERDYLSKITPEVVSVTGNPLTSSRELVIEFPQANTQDFPDLEKSLEVYCWPKNENPQRWVRDPFADGGPEKGKISGLWRFVSASGVHARRTGLFLTLREGYASTFEWDEARVISRDILPQTDYTPLEGIQSEEDYIDVLFPNFDPKKVQTQADLFLSTGPHEDPTVSTHDYSGIYEVIHCRPREEEDGSQSLITLIGKPRSFTKTYENFESHNESVIYNLHHVPKRIVQSIIDDPVYKISGASVTHNFSTERGTYDLIIRHGPENPITILNMKVEDGCQLEVYADFYYGITKETADGFVIEDAPKGWIYRIQGPTPAANGRFNLRRERIKAIAATGTEYDSEVTSSRVTTTREKKNQGNAANVGNPVQGIIKVARSLLNRFCRYEIVLKNTTSTPWQITYTIPGPDGDEIHIEKGNQRAIVIGDPGEGFYFRLAAGVTRNEDGTFYWHLAKEVDQYSREVTSQFPYHFWRHRSLLVVAPSGDAGKYQDQQQVDDWVFESRRFNKEDDAYAWLRETGNLQESSGVTTQGKTRFYAYKRYITAVHPWQNIGFPYFGA